VQNQKIKAANLLLSDGNFKKKLNIIEILSAYMDYADLMHILNISVIKRYLVFWMDIPKYWL